MVYIVLNGCLMDPLGILCGAWKFIPLLCVFV